MKNIIIIISCILSFVCFGETITLKTDIANYVHNEGINILAEIPTKNGVHFIIPPINSKKFTETFPNVDLHPNSMGTILYIPKSLD